ncbi:MAG: GntP family permease [Bacteroidales bacterium]|nr:GntP family permease [Bacteroidales bacterium]
MTGIPFIIVFVLAIAAMILLISRFKVHPFFSIMGVSLLLAIVAGIPIRQIPGVIGSGFSATFTSIGIVIVFGAFIGAVLEKTGAALKLADIVIRLVGEKHPELALELMGWVVSVPVFCDSGFVILDPVRKSLARRTGVSSVALTMCLSCGLYISHVFIPPTPGPIAAAQTLGIGENLLMVMGLGIVCSIFPLIAGYIFARHIGRKVPSADIPSDGSEALSYEELKSSFGRLPSACLSLAPIMVPILLMALSSVASMARWNGFAAVLCIFLGTPMIAMAIGAILAIILLHHTGQGDLFFKLTDNTLRAVGPILFVTAAGGVLGKVIATSDLVNYITSHASTLQVMGIVFPFLLAAILKSAQGSSTVAITTTAGLVAPLLPALGLVTPVEVTLAVMAIGAGAMTVSHANDSYFWVVTRFGGLDVKEGYRTQTLMTFVIGVAAMFEIFLLKLFIF